MRTKFEIFLLFILITFPIHLYGQEADKQSVVSGNIIINRSNQIQLGDTVKTIAKDGSFRFEIKANEPDYYKLSYENKTLEIFIIPGELVEIECDGKEFPKSLSFTGKQSDYNNFVVECLKLHSKVEDYLRINSKSFRTLDVLTYCEKTDSLMELELNHLKIFASSKDNIEKWFTKKIDTDIRFFFKIVKLVYPVRFSRAENKDVTVRPDYYDEIAKGSFDDPDYLRSQNYLDFVEKYLDVQTAGSYKFKDFYNLPVKLAGMPRYKAIIDFGAHQKITDYFLANLLKSHMSYGPKNIADLVELFKKDCKDNGLKQGVIRLYEKQIENRKLPSEIKVFKKVDDVELEAHIFYPEGFKKNDKRPLYVFFHGGSWNDGNPEWGYKLCQKYASKGMVAVSFEYELMDLHGVSIPNCIDDAKSAIRWARKNEQELGIDAKKIIAEGFSAGGHLAACTAIIKDDDSVLDKYSCEPNALILKSASYSVKGFGGMKGKNGELFSPLYQVKSGLVPTIMFHGTEDRIVAYKEFTAFVDKMKELKNDFVYHSFNNAGHFDLLNEENDKIESEMIDEFLVSHDLITK